MSGPGGVPRPTSPARATAATAALALVAAVAAIPSLSPAPLAAQATHVVVVTGLGGSPEFSRRFAEWGRGMTAAAEAAGVPAANVTWLAEREALDPAVDGVARTEGLAAVLAGLTERSSPDDLVVVALFGHGSARGGESRLNLPGPDLTAPALDVLLDALAPRRLVVVNAASASGGFVEPLAAPGRVVITATRSPGEAEATRFGGHFVAALAGGGADTDKDGRVSFLEAFEYARREVAREFAEGGHLPTEHALLDDDGDGVGSLEPAARAAANGAGGADGRLAATLTLAPSGAGREVGGDPATDSLRARQAALRSDLDALRARKESMSAEAYDAELERLLLEIARTGRAIREAGGADGGADAGAGTGGGP